jgi:hypothetical protein
VRFGHYYELCVVNRIRTELYVVIFVPKTSGRFGVIVMSPQVRFVGYVFEGTEYVLCSIHIF